MSLLNASQDLYQAVISTEPGRLAAVVSDVLYYHSQALGDKSCRELAEVRHYLEVLANKELKERIEKEFPWVKQFLKKSDVSA